MNELRTRLHRIVSGGSRDDRVALLMSAGIDSVSTGITCEEVGKDIRAYTYELQGYRSAEREKVEALAQHFGWPLKVITVPTRDLYYHRYTDDCVDLCDVLSSFSYGGKVKLDELSRIMGLPGKPGGMDGSQVAAYFNAGRIQEIADYCKSDVINTYRLWLRHELFRGRLDHNQFEASEENVSAFI
jgi:Predicted 3'-5' exonuclease related to the exonuclease domain of PolB/Asparagine synthase